MQWIVLGIIYGGSVVFMNIAVWITLGFPEPTNLAIGSMVISLPVLIFSCYKYYKFFKTMPKVRDFYDMDLYYEEFTPRHINYLQIRGLRTIKITPRSDSTICVTVNTCDKYLNKFRSEFKGNMK